MSNRFPHVRAYLFCVLLVAIDQATKIVAVEELSFGSVAVLPFFTLRLACNTGAAFSIFEGYGFWLAIAGIVFAFYFIFAIWQTTSRQILERIAFTLILAGDIGNVIDRLSRGCVVDFVHLHYKAFNFPIFNVADSCITIGAGLWILALFTVRFRTPSVATDD